MPNADPFTMYVPASYRAEDPRAIIRSYPFATLVTTGAQGLLATLTPIFFASDEPQEMELVGHLAARNPQAESLVDGADALVIFAGPHAYVSAGWYRERPTVPTWNYVAAQVRGTLVEANRDTDKMAVLERTTQLLEQGSAEPWTMEQAPVGRVADLLPHIRAFRMRIGTIEGATKLSQAQPASDRLRVIEALERRALEGDVDVARLMRNNDGL